MNIYFDNCDISKINDKILMRMQFIYQYLDEGWKCKYYKKNDIIILKKNNNKIILSYTFNPKIFNYNYDDNSFSFILVFLFNVMNDEWTIKKEKDEFIFYKNHEGKKEIFSDKYIKSFLEDNFNLKKLIK